MLETILKLLGLAGSFETLIAIGALVMVLEEAIDRFWDLDGKWAQLRTIVTGMVLGVIGAFANLGMFSDPECCGTTPDLWCGLAIGFSAAIAVNVAFLLPLSKALLELIKVRPKSKAAPLESDVARPAGKSAPMESDAAKIQ